jgi:molybdopterin synthase catalytic subunit
MTAIVEIGAEPLAIERAIAAVRTDADGAVVTFLGVARERSDDGRSVAGLSYEAYPALALAQMREIVDEAERRFAPCRVACLHRVGNLALGEASVAIAVAAPHRAAAFAACEFVIDELKARVAIWKKEHYRDGEAEWRANASAPRP